MNDIDREQEMLEMVTEAIDKGISFVAVERELASKMAAIVDVAITAEREACARIAEAAPVYGNNTIAALIRGQKP